MNCLDNGGRGGKQRRQKGTRQNVKAEVMTKVALEIDEIIVDGNCSHWQMWPHGTRLLAETLCVTNAQLSMNSRKHTCHSNSQAPQSPRVVSKLSDSLLLKENRSRGFSMACEQDIERQEVKLKHLSRGPTDHSIVIDRGKAVSAAQKPFVLL